MIKNKKQTFFSCLTFSLSLSQKHERTVFVLESHPTNERLLCSAGHDGLLIIWDIIDGRVIKQFVNDVNLSRDRVLI